MGMEGLSMICAGLGVIEEDDKGNRIGYAKSEHCLENLKDLLRFLRRDDPQSREVFKQVCKWNTVSNDLIPIIEHCQDESNLVLNAVKVLVFLTMPIEPASSDIPQQIEYLWGLKTAITCSDIVAVAVSLLESPLENLELENFTEDDWKLVQLVLTLFRNILAVQDISLQQKAGGSATQYLSIRDRFLELLFRENVMDLIIALTQHIGTRGYLRQDSLLFLETFHYIFMGQEPELIAKAYLKGSKVDADAEASLNSLKSIMKAEEEKKRLTRSRNIGRHSQFNVTFTRLTMDGSKTVLKGNPCSASHDVLLKSHKAHQGPSKRTVWDLGRLPSANGSILELLHDFVNQFLSGGYNVLMQSIREDIEKEHHAIQHCDVVIFFQVAQFATSFQYHKCLICKPHMETETSEGFGCNLADSTFFKGNVCGPIAASMNESMFLLVISKWRYAFEGLKETNEYKFLSAAGSLVKIMVMPISSPAVLNEQILQRSVIGGLFIHILNCWNKIRMLDLVLKFFSEDSKEPETARILLYKLFYDQTDQGMTQFLLGLIKTFNTHKQPKSDLADLVEMIHIVVRLMEKLQEGGTLRVSRKSRKVRKKKPLSDKNAADTLNGEHVPIQNEIGISSCEIPGDLNVSEEVNRKDLYQDMNNEDVNITAEVGEPESISEKVDESELSALDMKKIGGQLPQMDNKKSDHTNDGLLHEMGDSSSDEELAETAEGDLKVSGLVSAFANNTIIHNLCWLLSFYKSNSSTTNHYIICMLRRICEDLELSPMLYQLSLLTTFHDILAEQKSCPCKEYENIVHFLKSLVRRMLRKLKSQPLLFVEMLFWKTRRECHYINSETLLHELCNLKKQTRDWGSASGYEDVDPVGRQGRLPRSIADALGDDEAEFVISPELDNKRNDGSFEELKEDTADSDREIDGKETNAGHSVKHEFERGSKRKRRFILNDELEAKIKGLYEKYKDDQHCNRLIAEALDLDVKVTPLQVSSKLKRLGLKVPSRKRIPHANGTSAGGLDELREGKRANESVTSFYNTNDVEGSSVLRQPLHTSKRVRAFSEDQESTIKSLFEQFKDHKRCSYMIAKALDAEGSFTAAQVSRKLKQLGLHVPRQKNSEANMQLRDEDCDNYFTDDAKNSDDETLVSLRNRNKIKIRSVVPSEEVSEQQNEGNLSEDDSDDELLSSVMKKTRGSAKEKGVKLTATWREQQPAESDLGLGVTQDVIRRNVCEQDSDMEIAEVGKDDGPNHTSLDGNSEAEETGTNVEKQLGIASVSILDNLQHQQSYDDLAAELEDSGDDVAPATSPIRRKSRMVIDLEDEE